MYPQSSEPQKPTVVKWYAIYCYAMALMYLVCAFMGLVFLFGDPAEMEMDAVGAKFMGALLILMGLGFGALYGAAPSMPLKKWAWVVGIVLICFGLTSACCLPAAIPLLIWWLKPETKAYYNAG
ncbi:MAG TPA: hypothetical protein VF297_19510 [Pyrinomonadaceae bacterium]